VDLANKLDSKFRLAIIVARRAKQLINGAKPLVEIEAQNPLTIAIDEVNKGLVTMEMLDNVNIYLAEPTELSLEEETAEGKEGELELPEEKAKVEIAPEETKDSDLKETKE